MFHAFHLRANATCSASLSAFSSLAIFHPLEYFMFYGKVKEGAPLLKMHIITLIRFAGDTARRLRESGWRT